MSRQALAVLTEQAKALLLRVKSFQKSIEYSASQPSETLSILKEIQYVFFFPSTIILINFIGIVVNENTSRDDQMYSSTKLQNLKTIQ